MNRLFAIMIACLVALASFGPQVSMAMEQAPASQMAMEMGGDGSGADHAQSDCCEQPGHLMSDLHGHCGMSCAIMADAFSAITPLPILLHRANESAGLLASHQTLPEKPPRPLF